MGLAMDFIETDPMETAVGLLKRYYAVINDHEYLRVTYGDDVGYCHMSASVATDLETSLPTRSLTTKEFEAAKALFRWVKWGDEPIESPNIKHVLHVTGLDRTKTGE